MPIAGNTEGLAAEPAGMGALPGVGHRVPQHVALVGAQLVAHLTPPHLHPQHGYFFHLERCQVSSGRRRLGHQDDKDSSHSWLAGVLRDLSVKCTGGFNSLEQSTKSHEKVK